MKHFGTTKFFSNFPVMVLKGFEAVNEVQWIVLLHCFHLSELMQYEGLVHLKGMYAEVDCKLLLATFSLSDFFLKHVSA